MKREGKVAKNIRRRAGNIWNWTRPKWVWRANQGKITRWIWRREFSKLGNAFKFASLPINLLNRKFYSDSTEQISNLNKTIGMFIEAIKVRPHFVKCLITSQGGPRREFLKIYPRLVVVGSCQRTKGMSGSVQECSDKFSFHSSNFIFPCL